MSQQHDDLDRAMKAGSDDRLRGPSTSVLRQLLARTGSSGLGVNLTIDGYLEWWAMTDSNRRLPPCKGLWQRQSQTGERVANQRLV